ncbi:phosphatase PAP2 family protein [Camelliibacillus cellulosilyticus]|uniref:Phosphatase PAP2 family protein n=2 Tax=Camelliibacillus cellulosilyticus TaxID=2174486 RepID=A0ABV9GSA0_9BACL
MKAITFFGAGKVLMTIAIVISIYFIVFQRRPVAGVVFMICVIGSSYLFQDLKVIFHRPRPLDRLIDIGGYSYPSGHATMSTACYGMIAFLLYKYIKHQFNAFVWFFVIAGLWVLLIGASRVYLGVHYPSDVLAGMAVGGIWLLICVFTVNQLSPGLGRK